jgi:hypothetical protein
MAVKFAIPNAKMSRKPCLFNIKWNEGLGNNWLVENGAYSEEREVIIRDGMTFKVIEVKDEEIHVDYRKVTVIYLESEYLEETYIQENIPAISEKATKEMKQSDLKVLR